MGKKTIADEEFDLSFEGINSQVTGEKSKGKVYLDGNPKIEEDEEFEVAFDPADEKEVGVDLGTIKGDEVGQFEENNNSQIESGESDNDYPAYEEIEEEFAEEDLEENEMEVIAENEMQDTLEPELINETEEIELKGGAEATEEEARFEMNKDEEFNPDVIEDGNSEEDEMYNSSMVDLVENELFNENDGSDENSMVLGKEEEDELIYRDNSPTNKEEQIEEYKIQDWDTNSDKVNDNKFLIQDKVVGELQNENLKVENNDTEMLDFEPGIEMEELEFEPELQLDGYQVQQNEIPQTFENQSEMLNTASSDMFSNLKGKALANKKYLAYFVIGALLIGGALIYTNLGGANSEGDQEIGSSEVTKAIGESQKQLIVNTGLTGAKSAATGTLTVKEENNLTTGSQMILSGQVPVDSKVIVDGVAQDIRDSLMEVQVGNNKLSTTFNGIIVSSVLIDGGSGTRTDIFVKTINKDYVGVNKTLNDLAQGYKYHFKKTDSLKILIGSKKYNIQVNDILTKYSNLKNDILVKLLEINGTPLVIFDTSFYLSDLAKVIGKNLN